MVGVAEEVNGREDVDGGLGQAVGHEAAALEPWQAVEGLSGFDRCVVDDAEVRLDYMGQQGAQGVVHRDERASSPVAFEPVDLVVQGGAGCDQYGRLAGQSPAQVVPYPRFRKRGDVLVLMQDTVVDGVSAHGPQGQASTQVLGVESVEDVPVVLDFSHTGQYLDYVCPGPGESLFSEGDGKAETEYALTG